MKVLFILLKNNEKMKGLDTLGYRFLYSAYANDPTFFLQNIDSVMELAKTFKEVSSFFDLSYWYWKSERRRNSSLRHEKY